METRVRPRPPVWVRRLGEHDGPDTGEVDTDREDLPESPQVSESCLGESLCRDENPRVRLGRTPLRRVSVGPLNTDFWETPVTIEISRD